MLPANPVNQILAFVFILSSTAIIVGKLKEGDSEIVLILLIPALAYLVSFAAGARQGAALGRQTAAASLGQAAGSAAAGWLFAVLIEVPFWVTAGLLGLGAVAALRVSNTLNEVTQCRGDTG